jgi:excisionase family DNA binding protein
MAVDRRFAEKLIRIEQRLRKHATPAGDGSAPPPEDGRPPRRAPLRYLTVREVASRVSVSAPTVLRAIRSGDLRASRPGKRSLRVHPDDLEAWLEDRRAVR